MGVFTGISIVFFVSTRLHLYSPGSFSPEKEIDSKTLNYIGSGVNVASKLASMANKGKSITLK